jgi:UDP-N-acetylmuramoylalanine--D-glutamate ligase
VNGAHIAVLGAGRSGAAVARAARDRGAIVTLYDQKPIDQLGEVARSLTEEGISVVGGFGGPFHVLKTDILVTSPGVDSRSPVLVEAQKEGIEVISEIEFAYRIATVPIIAITGTNGKSTTTVMTWEVLSSYLGPAALCGNIYGSGYDECSLTEAAAEPENVVLVCEVSSFQLEWITTFRPHMAAITNITPDHLNRYDSFGAYAATKRRIWSNMDPNDVYVHHDDPMTAPPAGHRFQSMITRYDSENIYLPDSKISLRGFAFQAEHMIKNAAMSCSLAYAFDARFGPDPMRSVHFERGLNEFKGLAHRMERVGSRDGVELINNSMCTNPGAVVASSSGIPANQHLLIGGLTKDLDFTPVGNYLKDSGHHAYLYGADGSKINSQLGGVFPVFRTMAEAFNAAVERAKAGEVVILAPGCASMDQYQDFRARGDEFKQLAKEWLENEQTVTH